MKSSSARGTREQGRGETTSASAAVELWVNCATGGASGDAALRKATLGAKKQGGALWGESFGGVL